MTGFVTKAQAVAALAADIDISDAAIDEAAQRLAQQVGSWARVWRSMRTPDDKALRELHRIARRHHVATPAQASLSQQLNRMSDKAWWRRALHRRYRQVEQHARERGAVHRKASPYVSPRALSRYRRGLQRTADLLDSMEAVNLDTGESIPLTELAEQSQANPAKRRMAMMHRIRHIEGFALSKGHEGLFVTITAPSRMHARHEDGRPNARYDGTDPRQVQAYLNRVWRKAMRAAQHRGLTLYGLRTVEPHHDACPHWHMVVFTPPAQAEALCKTLRAYALADSPNEPGAAERRIVVKRIDPAEGSAAGYAAKYVAKNIDGHGLVSDTESDVGGSEAVTRIVAWSRLWGIRQFQFFGLPAITPTRELYRLASITTDSPALQQAHEASRAKDYTGYLQTLEANQMRFAVSYDQRPSSRYQGEIARAITGLVANALDLAHPFALTTRIEQWCIQPREKASSTARSTEPWTRFNNCAPPYGSSTCESTPAPASPAKRKGDPVRRRRRPAHTSPPSRPAHRKAKPLEEITC